MKNLASFNATPARRVWSGYTLETRFAVGKNGSQRSHRGRTGAKLHLLETEVVIAEEGEHKPGTYGVGATFSVRGVCASNGQHTGTVVAGTDTDVVDCERCMKILARMEAR